MKRMLAVVLLLVPALPASAKGIRGSKHDLTRTGPGPVKAVSERDPCVFCHVSHRGMGRGSNRPELTGSVEPYRSSTMSVQAPEKPTGATSVCLSCHDGTIAIGQTRRRSIDLTGTASGGKMPAGSSLLGRDLRGTHPVSFPLKETSKVRRPHEKAPVRLDRAGEMHCTACHDPHEEFVDPDHGKFLAATPRGSKLCSVCHAPTVYRLAGASHVTSRLAPPPGVFATANQADRTVEDAGCLACHPQHGAEPGSPLLKPAASEDKRCLGCHDGQVLPGDIVRQIAKPYAHASVQGHARHDAGEGPASQASRLPEVNPAAKRHVTCADCHNPHQSSRKIASAPRAGGALAGVWGIDRNGLKVDPVLFEYEVCFKCHADSANQPQAKGPPPGRTVRRAVIEVSLRRAFDPAAPSFHPVVAPGRNPKVPSLVAPLTASSQIYCGDCHGSDETSTGGGVPRGPHGSIYPYLLARNYGTADGTPETPEAYALCYQCHSRDKLLSTETTFSRLDPAASQRESLHRRHLQGGAPCSACHNAHGVSAAAGNPVNNAHLIDFDVSIVGQTSQGLRRYQSAGPGAGSCALSCHGRDHGDLGSAYGP